jgi:hypothetical protein
MFGVLIVNKLLYTKWETCVYFVGAQLSFEDVVNDDDGGYCKPSFGFMTKVRACKGANQK